MNLSASRLDGKSTSLAIESTISTLISILKINPCLVIIKVGSDSVSNRYVSRKIEACARVGINAISLSRIASSTTDLTKLILEYNAAANVHGILVQLPLPKNIDTQQVLRAVSPRKDVDGIHPENLGRILIGDSYLSPATPTGIIHLLKSNGIQLKGKRIAVVGRSVIVGKPMAAMLTNADATVTLCHSQTKNLTSLVQDADIVVAAVGSQWLIRPDMVKPGAVVVDVGINHTSEGVLVGDVHPDVGMVAGWLTPVPGGVGPMTIAALLSNTLKAFLLSTPDALQYLKAEAEELLGSLYPDLL